MPKFAGLKKIFVIGSGPIAIGQGCEFDYSGTQACKALLEEDCEVILLNANPATIMTDERFAHATYIAPMTVETCQDIIAKERPNALLPTVGGQTALNLALALAERGILAEAGVHLIGASVEAIKKAENRQLFRKAMQKVGLDMPKAFTLNHLEALPVAIAKLKFPIVVRTSFTLGGEGSGIAYDEVTLRDLCENFFAIAPEQTLALEEALIGWKEFEMEAIRDRMNNCIIVCSIENVDPMGIHTGDSITVAPAQTLCNKAYQAMRSATFAVMREIGVDTGGANVQFAVHPQTGKMRVIEMNPRVSRSSALASKATGYPIASIATKLALGFTLDELENRLTRDSISAAFEPSIDYVVTKLPRFNFEKFPDCRGVLTTKMQSIGEVMGIGRNFQESLQKALCSLEQPSYIKSLNWEAMCERIAKPYYDRLFYIIEAFRLGISIEIIHQYTHIDFWFLSQLKDLVNLQNKISNTKLSDLSLNDLKQLKRKGFSDHTIAALTSANENEVRAYRENLNIKPVFKRMDSCAAEFDVKRAALYSTYESECEATSSKRKKILVIGSGPNRIGQGLEFDYGSVHAALAARALGFETIMINSNPETVSTDYDIVDRLYLEPLALEYILNVIAVEKPVGVITQFGGQTALNLMPELVQANIPLLGTTAASVEICENRDRFKEFLQTVNVKQPENFCVHDQHTALQMAEHINYPVIVRPSYLLSGSAMKVMHTPEEFSIYFKARTLQQYFFPVLVERYLEDAIEVEVDGICDGEDVFIPGLMEQYEPVGVHSGDSICCFPPCTLSSALQNRLIATAREIALALKIVGLFNIQFAVQNDSIYVIEVNPRASRTLPFLSKALGISLPQIATNCLLGKKLKEQNLSFSKPSHFFLKIPYFPFDRLGVYELSPEMRSTGESMLISIQAPWTSPNNMEKFSTTLVSMQSLRS